MGYRRALRVGNGDESEGRPAGEGLVEVRQIQPAVQRGNRPTGLSLEERKVEQLRVEMHHVESGSLPADFVDHAQVSREITFQRAGVETQCSLATGDQTRLGARVACGEKCDFVAEIR